MYESPIKMIYDDMQTLIIKHQENDVYQAVQQYGITVDKEELLKERHLFSNRYIPEFFFICIYIVLKVSNDFTFYSYSFIEYIGSGLFVLI